MQKKKYYGRGLILAGIEQHFVRSDAAPVLLGEAALLQARDTHNHALRGMRLRAKKRGSSCACSCTSLFTSKKIQLKSQIRTFGTTPSVGGAKPTTSVDVRFFDPFASDGNKPYIAHLGRNRNHLHTYIGQPADASTTRPQHTFDKAANRHPTALRSPPTRPTTKRKERNKAACAPSLTTSLTVISLRVRVPVLSAQMTVAHPSASTAGSRFTIAFLGETTSHAETICWT